MGQTLTHGIYLPDEGERNCYSGLAANWQILDNSVGTIAEHTSALAGKAPLVHTHTKADITDFPALANVATSGSYNDLNNIPASFTPSSHTHGNLTNDGKVGTTANLPLITGTDGVVQAGSFGNAANTFCEGNDSRLSDARTPVAHTHTKSDVTDLLNSDFIPSANNSYDLGSSSYQWNNLYAKGCYYNGVAWGLDKANVWSENQTFSAKILTKTANAEITGEDVYQCLKSDGKRAISFRVSNNSSYRTLLLGVHDTNNSPPKGLVISNDNSNNITIFSDSPGGLGTSTNKWKTLNGVNPGALSLPSGNAINIDTTSWVYDGATANSWTATVDCWVTVYSVYARLFILKNTTLEIGSVSERAGSYTNYVFVPARKGDVVVLTANGASNVTVIAYPCQGNV